MGECFKSHGDQSDIRCGSIKITNLVIITCRVPAGVGVLLLADYTEQADIAVGERLDGATATSGA